MVEMVVKVVVKVVNKVVGRKLLDVVWKVFEEGGWEERGYSRLTFQRKHAQPLQLGHIGWTTSSAHRCRSRKGLGPGQKWGMRH
jgi:hypothetical protein